MDSPTIRLRTAELRARLNRMTQTELAKRAGLSKTTVCNLESGRLRRIELETIAKLCQALACKPNDLFEIGGQAEVELAGQQRRALDELLGRLEYSRSPIAGEIDATLASLVVREDKQASKQSRKQRKQ